MSLYPDAQKKAQAELDLVVGPDRLPTHEDIPMLPYVNAIAKEALRWLNVLPIGIPHQTTEDIVYNGYFIPSGTLLIPTTWYVGDPTAVLVSITKRAYRSLGAASTILLCIRSRTGFSPTVSCGTVVSIQMFVIQRSSHLDTVGGQYTLPAGEIKGSFCG